MHLVTIPNILSVSRVFLGLIMFWSVYSTNWVIAVCILWIAIATDIADGYLARSSGNATALGGTLDHGSDAFFVTCTILGLAFLGMAPFALTFIIPVAFFQYLLDSSVLSGQPLRASFIGRYNGIAYFVFAGWPVMQYTLGLTVIPFDWFIWIGWGLVITSAISMVDRLVTLLSNKRNDE